MSLVTALDHLRRFRATFNAGEPVDEESGLTADDLTTIINVVEAFGEDVVAGIHLRTDTAASTRTSQAAT